MCQIMLSSTFLYSLIGSKIIIFQIPCSRLTHIVTSNLIFNDSLGDFIWSVVRENELLYT